jgi:hypothetical protein
VTAYVNGAPVDCVPVTTAATYILAITALSTDNVAIRIESGPC